MGLDLGTEQNGDPLAEYWLRTRGELTRTLDFEERQGEKSLDRWEAGNMSDGRYT